MPFLLRSLATAALQYGVAETLLRGAGARRRLGRAVSGVGFILVAVAITCVTLAFLLAGLFFRLAEQMELVMPALITGLVGAAMAVALISEGTRRLKK